MSDLERKLLAHLTDSDCIAEVWGMGLTVEVFEDPLCRSAYDFITGYWLDNQMALAPTAYILEEELPGLRLAADVEESVGWLAERMQKRYITNQLQDMLVNAAAQSNQDPLGTLAQLASASYAAAEQVAPRNTRSDMSNIEARRQRYNERAQRPGGIGLPLGISELDAHTGGLMPGELAVVGAYSKVGKTVFLVNAAAALRKAGHLPIVFTLEMSIAEIEDRIDALYSGVSYNRFIHSDLDMDEARVWHRAQEELNEAGGILVESPEEGARTVASLVNRARQVGADFVLIDQLSHMEPGKTVRNDKEHHATIMKQLSTELSRPGKEIPCLMAVQLNRESINGNQPVGMQHFANADEIAREVDLALGLARTGEERRNRVMQLHILGARRSDVKSWMLRWDLVDRSLIEVLSES